MLESYDSTIALRSNGNQALKLQLHDAIYRLRFYSNSLIHILSLSNSQASLQKNWGDKSHRVSVALFSVGSADVTKWILLCIRLRLNDNAMFYKTLIEKK